METYPEHLVLFDGECGLCDKSVQFLLNKDTSGILYFSPLQGDLAHTLLSEHTHLKELDSILYVRTQKECTEIFAHSSAVSEICSVLPAPWSWLRIISWIPKFLRDFGYRLVAKHRLRFFGKAPACRIPSPEEQQRFL